METSVMSPKGRIRRSAYWSRVLLSNFLMVLALLMLAVIVKNAGTDSVGYSCIAIGICLYIYVLVYNIIQGIKRMHDCDKSGWYLLIPLYNFILSLTEGTRGPNQYGADPKAAGNSKIGGAW
jgi:uncharacterized membrane protein YhaH (DUF805 family)